MKKRTKIEGVIIEIDDYDVGFDEGEKQANRIVNIIKEKAHQGWIPEPNDIRKENV